MAAISFGHSNFNSGFQTGINNGTINFAPERPETPPLPLSNVPFLRDPDFIDCGELLSQISEKGTKPGARIAVVGLGGVGKSQLAIELCYRIRERSPETWIFWIHAGNATRYEQGFRDIADQLKIPRRRDPTANIFKLVHDWLIDQRKGRWILILDNVDDSRFLHEMPPVEQSASSDRASARPLLAYLPVTQNGSIIITSRSRDAAGSIVESNDIFTAEPMDLSHATKLFQKKLRAPQLEDKKSIHRLATALDYMPLAIVQAAAYIVQRAPRFSVAEYLKEFEKNDRSRASLLAYDGGKLRRDREAKNSILITWQISFDYIQQSQPAAANLLSLLSFFDRQGIPSDLLHEQEAMTDENENENDVRWEGGSDLDVETEEAGTGYCFDENFENNIALLRSYSMISIGADGTTLEMHRLVQLAMRTWLELHGQLEHYKQQFVEILSNAFPSGEFETWDLCQSLLSHVRCAVTYPPAQSSTMALRKWASLLERSARFMSQKEYALEALNMAVLSMNARKRLFGPNDKRTLNSAGQVSLAYVLQGRWKEAEELNIQVLETRKQPEVLGPEHPDTLTSISNLALIYENQGRWKEAEALNIQVLETCKQPEVLGPEHPDTLISMGNLALIYKNQGRWKEAEALNIQVLETCKQALGPQHPHTLTSMGNLASIYRKGRRWKEAEELHIQVLEMRKQVLGPEHPGTLTSMGNLALIYENQGRWKEAEELHIQVLRTRKRVLGPEHPSTLVSMNNLAHTLRGLQQFQAAIQLMSDCVRLQNLVLGPDHPDTISSTSALADWSDISKDSPRLSQSVLKSESAGCLSFLSCLPFCRK